MQQDQNPSETADPVTDQTEGASKPGIYDVEIVSSDALRKVREYLFPRVLAILCMTGLLAGCATLVGVALAWHLPDLREGGTFISPSDYNFCVKKQETCCCSLQVNNMPFPASGIREDVMWVMFLSQLAILIPFSVYVCYKKWVQIEIDNRSKGISRVFGILAVVTVAGFLAIHARVLQNTFRWGYDGEFMGCAIMYLGGSVALLPILRKYRIFHPRTTHTVKANTGSYRLKSWMYCGITAATVLVTAVSFACFCLLTADKY